MNFPTDVAAPPDDTDWREALHRIEDKANQQLYTDPLVTLGRFHELNEIAERAMEQAVREARRQGHSWTDIAEATGEPRQNAWRRWHQIRKID